MGGTKIRRLLAATTVAAVAMISVAGAALARPAGTLDENIRPVERTEGEKYADNYGFGSQDETVLDRGQIADAARLHASAAAHVRRRMDPADEFVSDLYGFRLAQEGIVTGSSETASVPAEASSVDGLEGGQVVALTASLILLAGIGTLIVVRNQRSRTAI